MVRGPVWRPAFFPVGRRGKWLRREYRVTSKLEMMWPPGACRWKRGWSEATHVKTWEIAAWEAEERKGRLWAAPLGAPGHPGLSFLTRKMGSVPVPPLQE